MSFSSAEFAWNSVDVRGDDGLLHNGRVIDVVDEGLIVHFGGTGYSGARLVPFGDVYYRRYSRYLNWMGQDIDSGREAVDHERPVEVLLRLKPEDPWKWYPGILLDGFGLVSVSLPGGVLKGIVVEERIRGRSEGAMLADRSVGRDQILRKMVGVPSEFGPALTSDDQLIAAFNTHCRQRGYWMTATHVRLGNAHHGLYKELAILEMCDDPFLFYTFPGKNFDLRKNWQQPLDQVLLDVLKSGADNLDSVRQRFLSPPALCSEGDIQSLYRDPSIFPQIFECLTTVEQSTLRAVCKTWDSVLMSARIRRAMTLSLPHWCQDHKSELYRFPSCVYSCWTQQTQTLTICGGRVVGDCDDRLDRTAHLLQCTMAEKGLPATRTLLLAGQWELLVRGYHWVNALYEILISLMGVCQQVVLKNVRINVKVVPSDWYEEDTHLYLFVHFSNQRLTRQLTVTNFWDILDSGICDLDAKDMERLEEWIGANSAGTTVSAKIAQILNITQTLDPRDGVRYRGMTFAPVGDATVAGVDVRFLTKLTLYMLRREFVLDLLRSA